MNAALRAGLAVALSLVWVAAAIFWFEAEKEVRVLCGTFDPGDPVETVLRTLETGNLLRYENGVVEGVGTISVTSPYTLGTTDCRTEIAAGAVVSSDYRYGPRLEGFAAGVAAALLVGLAVFQLLLAAGRPLGHLAWGGARGGALPPALRWASLASAGVVALGAVLVLDRTAIVDLLGRPPWVDTGVWVMVALFLLSAVANGLSRSRSERRIMLPLALALAATCLVVALGP